MVVIGDDNYDGHNEHNMVVMLITMTEHGDDEMVVVVMMMVWMPLLLMVLAVVKTIMPQSVVTMVISNNNNNNSSNSNRSSISSDSSNTKTITAAPHSRRTRPIPVLMTVLGSTLRIRLSVSAHFDQPTAPQGVRKSRCLAPRNGQRRQLSAPH